MVSLYPVSWTAVCYVTVITLFIKKVGVVRPNFGGVRTPPAPPVVAPLGRDCIYEKPATVSACDAQTYRRTDTRAIAYGALT